MPLLYLRDCSLGGVSCGQSSKQFGPPRLRPSYLHRSISALSMKETDPREEGRRKGESSKPGSSNGESIRPGSSNEVSKGCHDMDQRVYYYPATAVEPSPVIGEGISNCGNSDGR